MRLQRVWIRGYKRFAEPVEIYADGKLTCIVGPNEAGKTSLLEALAHLSSDEPFRGGDNPSTTSRGASPADKDLLVEALFRLDSTDIAELSAVHGGEQVRWFYVGRRTDGELALRVEPKPSRNIAPRLRLDKTLTRLEGSRWLSGLDESEADPVFSSISEAHDVLRSKHENLDEAELEALSQLLEQLRESWGSEVPGYARQVPSDLESLLEEEKEAGPAIRAAQILWERSPRFAMFDDDDRLLQSAYQLPQVAGQPPAALANLAGLAGLNLRQLNRARETGDHGLIESIVEPANERLRQTITDAWNQSPVDVRFRLDGDTLRILVRTNQQGFWTIAERSDGMRAFIALTAFVSVRTETKPILLVDEAEAHLHYDAQADLIQMFEKQELASQVIYTTHSAGCLPGDLAAVRTVVPRDDLERSVIRNWFWEGNEPGFSPLLLGMGAATLAFVPTRYAVIAEGPSDFILLPLLMREATGRQWLGFQVAPGLAEARPAEIGVLDLEAARIVYVVDHDSAGRSIRTKLERAGIDAERIVEVSRTRDQVIEDLLAADKYLNAVNACLASSGHKPLPKDDIKPENRPRVVARWCSRNGIPAPSKRAVAQQLLDMSREGHALLSTSGVDELVHLFQRLSDLLGLSDDS